MVYSNKREEMNKDMVFQIFRLHLNDMGGQIQKKWALIGSTKVKTTESGNDCYFLKIDTSFLDMV